MKFSRKIKLSKEMFDKLTQWSASSDMEQLGFLFAKKDKNGSVVPTQFFGETDFGEYNNFVKDRSPKWIEINEDAIYNFLKEVRKQNQFDAEIAVLMHTHPAKAPWEHIDNNSPYVEETKKMCKAYEEVRATMTSADKIMAMLSKWREFGVGLELMDGVATPSAVAFWDKKFIVPRRLDLEVDGKIIPPLKRKAYEKEMGVYLKKYGDEKGG